MPLFSITNGSLTPIQQTNFDLEKQLQALVESSLQPIFNCRLVASEFSTGSQHGGRIDTLALSEDNNPVIVEYKKIESSELINQSLFYLSWIHDHRGDFHIAAQKALGADVEVDWSDVRVICIAPNYRKYDLHAVQVMGANLELWTYRLFKNDTIYFEEVFQKTLSTTPDGPMTKDPVMVAAGKKAALTRQTGTYTYDEHIDGKPETMVELAQSVRDFVMGLDPAMEETAGWHWRMMCVPLALPVSSLSATRPTAGLQQPNTASAATTEERDLRSMVCAGSETRAQPGECGFAHLCGRLTAFGAYHVALRFIQFQA